MFQSIEVMLQRYADSLAAKSLDAAACIQQAFWPKEDPGAAACYFAVVYLRLNTEFCNYTRQVGVHLTSHAFKREALQDVKRLASFFGREEIPIYFQLLPPLQPINLFSYYQGMQLEPRILPSTLFRLGAVALVDYSFPSRPWIRRLTYTLSAIIIMFEAFPSLMWPLLHSTIFLILKMRNLCLYSNSPPPL